MSVCRTCNFRTLPMDLQSVAPLWRSTVLYTLLSYLWSINWCFEELKMTNDTSTTSSTSVTLEQTNDIAMTIDQVLADKGEIVKVLTQEQVERTLLLRELLMNAYVRGFFSGMQHAMKDLLGGKGSSS